MLDPYVLLTFKGTKEKEKIPRSGVRSGSLRPPYFSRNSRKKKNSQELLEVLDPYVLLTFKGNNEKRKKQELHEVWILTSSLLFKEFKKKEKFPGAAGGAGPLRPPYF